MFALLVAIQLLLPNERSFLFQNLECEFILILIENDIKEVAQLQHQTVEDCYNFIKLITLVSFKRYTYTIQLKYRCNLFGQST